MSANTNTITLPATLPMNYPMYGQMPMNGGFFPQQMAPNLAPESMVTFPGQNPTYNPYTRSASYLTSNNYINYLNEATNITQRNLEQFSRYNEMQSSNPLLSSGSMLGVWNRDYAPGLNKASETYKTVMQATEPGKDEHK